MHSKLVAAVQSDFLAFAQLALRELDGTKLSDDRYLDLLATRLIELHDGSIKRLLINLPPRHLKTQLCTICFAAWLLANDPTVKILIVTYGERLAKDISRSIRAILRARWFREIFATRISKDHSEVDNFRTSRGGGVYATSFDGAITGFGGDFIIIDDPHNQSDAGFPDKLQKTIDKFHSVVVNRLNRPKEGRILVVGHRVHENDLSADLLSCGRWTHVCLPAVAVKAHTYHTAYGRWRHRKGSVLRSDTTRADFERLRAKHVNPSYELLFLQDAEGEALPAIRPEHFARFAKPRVQNLPHFISIDPGAKDGADSSFSVLQLWAADGVNFYLVDEFRKQCGYDELARVTLNYARLYSGVPIIVEETANGPALLSALHRREPYPVVPKGTKATRFRPHVRKILSGRLHLLEHAPFARDFMDELVAFPHGDHTDQVDALTQFLSWIESRNDIDFSRKNFSPKEVIVSGKHYLEGTLPSVSSMSDDPNRGLSARLRREPWPIFPRPRPFIRN